MAISTLTDLPWKGTRIYSSTHDPEGEWYFRLLREFAVPFADKFCDVPFWFTRYQCSDEQDPVAAGFNLPPAFKFRPQNTTKDWHTSLRIRFASTPDTDAFITARLAGKDLHFLAEPISPYNPLSFADELTCGNREPASVSRRASLVGNVLCWNARFVIDVFKQGGLREFERNNHARTGIFESSFRQPLHLMHNIYGAAGGQAYPVLVAVGVSGTHSDWEPV